MISDCYETINNFNKNKDLIGLIAKFNDNYIMNKKKILYNKIKDLILENKKYRDKNNNGKKKFSINGINKNQNQLNEYSDSEDENDYLKQQNENLKERNENLKRENKELKENLTKNINEIVSRNNNIKISKLNIPSNILQNNSNNNILSTRNIRHLRNKTVAAKNQILYNILNQNNLKNNNNNNSNQHNYVISEPDSNNSNTENSNSNGKILLQLSKTNTTNSFFDFNMEEVVNSKSEIFSLIGTNGDKSFLETTQFGNEPGTPTLTPRSNYIDNNNSSLTILPINEINDNGNFGKSIKIEISKINVEKTNYKNIKKLNLIKKEIVDEKLPNNNYTLSTNCSQEKEKTQNTNDVIDMKNYDYLYMNINSKVTKLLLYNNDNVQKNEIFSDNIYYILNGNKKKKGILLITADCFYILDDTPDYNCELRISHRLLSSISISEDNFNHLLISFNDNSYIIVEIYRRMSLLEYLKDLYLCNKYKKINIVWCDSFNVKSKSHYYFYDLKNNKHTLLTPNFENAQKMGFLYLYKENFFSAYFTEKLIVLCSIGLIVFSKSNMNIPKIIIPIIGSSIKPIASYPNSNINETLYCFKIKTLNSEDFIFATTKTKELNDWIQELKKYQRLYDTKMKEIMSYYVVHEKNDNKN